MEVRQETRDNLDRLSLIIQEDVRTAG